MSITPSQLILSPTPRWIPIVKTFTDFAIAGLTNDIELFVLPSYGALHNCQIVPTTLFSGGTIASYTLSVGISTNLTKFCSAKNVFTGASLPTGGNGFLGIESISGNTSVRGAATSTVGNLDAATQGVVVFYLLVSRLI